MIQYKANDHVSVFVGDPDFFTVEIAEIGSLFDREGLFRLRTIIDQALSVSTEELDSAGSNLKTVKLPEKDERDEEHKFWRGDQGFKDRSLH